MIKTLLAVGLMMLVSVGTAYGASQAEQNEMSRTGTFPQWIEDHVGKHVHFFYACRQRRDIMELQEVGRVANEQNKDLSAFHQVASLKVNMGVCFRSPAPITGIASDIVDSFRTTRTPQGSHLHYWATVIKVMNPQDPSQILYAGVDLLEPQGV